MKGISTLKKTRWFHFVQKNILSKSLNKTLLNMFNAFQFILKFLFCKCDCTRGLQYFVNLKSRKEN